jgi:hypothetical protein
MKKILCAALAVAMMSSVALAAGSGTKDDPFVATPGGSIKLTPDMFKNASGEQISDEIDFTDEYFVVSSKKFTKGASLVKSISFVDDSSKGYILKLSLNQDYTNDIGRYTASNKTYANLVFSDLAVKAKKTVKDADSQKIISKGNEYSFDGTGKMYGQVGYDFTNNKITITDDDYDVNPAYDTAVAMKFVANDDGTAYTTVNAYYGDIAYTEGRVYDGDKVVYRYNQDTTTSILKAYPDAELEFVNMKTSDLPATCYFELYADEDEYVYKLENGKLVRSGLKWDDDVYAWVGKYRTACTYVISDIPLSTSASSASDVTVSEVVIPSVEVIPTTPVVVINPETGR